MSADQPMPFDPTGRDCGRVETETDIPAWRHDEVIAERDRARGLAANLEARHAALRDAIEDIASGPAVSEDDCEENCWRCRLRDALGRDAALNQDETT